MYDCVCHYVCASTDRRASKQASKQTFVCIQMYIYTCTCNIMQPCYSVLCMSTVVLRLVVVCARHAQSTLVEPGSPLRHEMTKYIHKDVDTHTHTLAKHTLVPAHTYMFLYLYASMSRKKGKKVVQSNAPLGCCRLLSVNFMQTSVLTESCQFSVQASPLDSLNMLRVSGPCWCLLLVNPLPKSCWGGCFCQHVEPCETLYESSHTFCLSSWMTEFEALGFLLASETPSYVRTFLSLGRPVWLT